MFGSVFDLNFTYGLAVATSKNGQEDNQVVVIGEEAIVIEVDVGTVLARVAGAACKHSQECNQIVIILEEAVAIEVDRVAAHGRDREIAAANGRGRVASDADVDRHVGRDILLNLRLVAAACDAKVVIARELVAEACVEG